jgi:hypothetical protein
MKLVKFLQENSCGFPEKPFGESIGKIYPGENAILASISVITMQSLPKSYPKSWPES